MTIEFSCPSCQKLLRTADDKAGLAANCPHCGGSLTVPGSAASGTADEFEVADEPPPLEDSFSAAPPPRPTGTKTCPMCGETVDAHAGTCRYCGESLRGRPGFAVSGTSQSLAVAALVTGASSLPFALCCGCFAVPLVITSFICGGMALSQIARGEAEGKGLAIIGMCCAGASILLAVGLLVLNVVLQGAHRNF